MKIKYIAVLYGEFPWKYNFPGKPKTPDDILGYRQADEIDNPMFCCDDMRNHWQEDYLGYGVKEGFNDCSDANGVHLYYRSAWTHDCYNEIEIKYCPFCGEKIELVEVSRVKKVRREKIIPQRVEDDYEEVSI